MIAKITATVFIGLGLLLLIGGLNTIAQHLALINSAPRTQGTVVRTYQVNHPSALRRREQQGPDYYAVVQYTTAAGTPYTVTTAIGATGDQGNFSVGQQVPIFYHPTDSTAIEIDTTGQLWALPLMLTFFGVVLLGFGLLTLWFARLPANPLVPARHASGRK